MPHNFKNNVDKVGVLYNRETRRANEGNLAQATEDFTKAIEIKTNDIMAYKNRGSAYSQRGEYNQAISDFTKAIGINSNDSVAYHNRAVAHFRLKLYGKEWADVDIMKEFWATVNPEIICKLKEVVRKL